MKSSKFIIPFVISLVATPPFLFLALVSTGAGHGDYGWARVLFPFTMLSAFLFGSITIPFIVLGIIQFPFFGFVLGKANVGGNLFKSLIVISLIHALSVVACFWL